jgi:hypothetical protein
VNKCSSQKFFMNALTKKLKALISEHPTEYIQAMLEHPFWPPTIETRQAYLTRYEDDSPTGNLMVMFSPDGDGWIEVISKPEPHEIGGSCFRFRTHAGGGQSERVRSALFVLAEAIRLDNEARPQHRSPE